MAREHADSDPSEWPDQASPFQRFENLVRRLIQVPRKETDDKQTSDSPQEKPDS